MFFLKIKLQFHKSSTRKLFMKLPLHPSLLYLSEALWKGTENPPKEFALTVSPSLF